MNKQSYRLKVPLVHLLLSCLVILGTALVNTPTVSAGTVKVYTKGNPQKGFGEMLQGLSAPRQFSDEFNNIIDSWCGSANGINNEPGFLLADACGAAVRKDPICTTITEPKVFTECVQTVAYKFLGGNKFSSFRYSGKPPVNLFRKARDEIKKTSPSWGISDSLQLIYFKQEPVKDADRYTEAKNLSTNQADLTKLQYAIDSTPVAPGNYKGLRISNVGFYKTYWDGCSPYIPWRPEDNESYRNTIFCETAESNRNNEIKLYLEFPEIDYSQVTLALCVNPKRANSSSEPPYDSRCTQDIIQNCFFNDEVPFDKCANTYRVRETSAITETQVSELTTDYCRKYLLSSESGGIPAYQNCLKNSALECDSHHEIQSYAQCVKRVAHQTMTSVGLCLAGEPTDEKVCSKSVCSANDIPRCRAVQGITQTKLSSCTASCPTGETLCKGPITGASNSDSAPYLYCYKSAAGQTGARAGTGAGTAGRPSAGANNAAANANKVGVCYSCQTTGGVTKWDRVGLTQMLSTNCDEAKLNETSNRSGIKYTGDTTWVDSAEENTGKPPEKPANCQVTNVAKYDCYVCTKGQGNNDNTWTKIADKITKTQCEINTRTARSITVETDKGERNTTNRQKADYCPIKGNIGSTLSSGARPPTGGGSIFGCKTTVNESSVTFNSAKAIPDFENTGNKVDGFDRVNWYLKKLPDGNYEFKGTNQNTKTETTFGAGSGSNVLDPNREYLIQAELYTQEGNNKREALPCAPDNFTTKPPPASGRQAMKFDANPTQAVLATATGPYTVGFYVKAGSEDVTELNVDVKAYGRGGGDASGAISLENIANGTARNGSVVRVKIEDPSQVEKLVVTTSYTFEGNLFPGASTTMYLNRLDDSEPVPESQLQKTTLKPLDVQTITISPPQPTSTGFILVRTTSTTSLGNWKIQVKKDSGEITEGGNADALTAGCENNLGGVCTYQANFSQLPEGKYEAQLLSEGNIKASSNFSVVAATLNPDGSPIAPERATELLPGQTNTADTVIIDLVKLSCSTRNSESADGEYVIFQDGSPRKATIVFAENVTQDTCSLTRYANGNMVDSSVIKFKVGAREEPISPGAPPTTDDSAAGAPGSEPDNSNHPECSNDNGVTYCEGGNKVTKYGGAWDGSTCQYNFQVDGCGDNRTCPDGDNDCRDNGSQSNDHPECSNDNGVTYCEGGNKVTKYGGAWDGSTCQYNFQVDGCGDNRTCPDGDNDCRDVEGPRKEPSCSWHQDDNGDGSYTEYREDCSSETFCFNPGAVTYCNGACSEPGWCVEGDPNKSDTNTKWYESCACH